MNHSPNIGHERRCLVRPEARHAFQVGFLQCTVNELTQNTNRNPLPCPMNWSDSVEMQRSLRIVFDHFILRVFHDDLPRAQPGFSKNNEPTSTGNGFLNPRHIEPFAGQWGTQHSRRLIDENGFENPSWSESAIACFFDYAKETFRNLRRLIRKTRKLASILMPSGEVSKQIG